MSQYEIIQILKQNKNWMNTLEINKQLPKKNKRRNTSQKLKRLHKYKLIDKRIITQHKKNVQIQYKIKN